MYQEKYLQQKAGTCGVSDTSLDDLGPRALEIYRSQPRVSSSIPLVSSVPDLMFGHRHGSL